MWSRRLKKLFSGKLWGSGEAQDSSKGGVQTAPLYKFEICALTQPALCADNISAEL